MPEDISPIYFHTKEKFLNCKSYIKLKFDHSLLGIENSDQFNQLLNKSPKSLPKTLTNEKKSPQKPKDSRKNYFERHRRLKLSNIITDQNKEFFIEKK